MNNRRTRLALTLVLAISLLGCGGGSGDAGGETTPNDEAHQAAPVETGSIQAAIDGPHRTEEERARDAFRHPRETLEFFGLEPSMNVVEMAPGGGWYTAILAPVMRDHGKLTVAVPDPEESTYTQTLFAKLAASPEVYDQVEHVIFELPERTNLGPDGSADMVVTFRSTHGWINNGGAPAVFEAMYRVLRPGGVLGLVQHRADEGADVTETSPKGYVPEAYVIELAQAAGFVLDERSEINANPNDTHDHPEGVWSLPPALRGDDATREERAAIGESDRMTLRFRRPAADEAAAAPAE